VIATRVLGAATLAALVACATKGPLLTYPVRIDSNCGQRNAQASSIESVMTSTDDTIGPPHPNAEGVRREVNAAGGAIAYWHDQLLVLPKSSRVLGETDGSARIRAVAITDVPDGASKRTIYLDVRDHGAYRWIAMTAYDTQSVCIVGRPQA
jgi:hypothetical protein